MLFSFPLENAANTSEASANHTQMKLADGVISRVLVDFPPGCAGLARLRILHNGRFLYPQKGSGYLAANNYTFDIPDAYELSGGNNVLDAYSWNLDDTYSHKITVHFVVQLREEIDTSAKVQATLNAMLNAFMVVRRSFEKTPGAPGA